MVLEIGFILFISMFALDVFEMEQWFLALIMHLIPSLVLIIITVIAWKWEFWGGILWVLTAIIVTLVTGIDWIITLPMAIIGGLNLWLGKSKTKKD